MILSKVDLQHEIKKGTISIVPFDEETIRENGVDLRISDEIARLRYLGQPQFDIATSKSDEFYCREKCGGNIIIDRFEKILVSTYERITLPNNLMAFCQLRSTFARGGILIPPTVVDSGFSGNLTIQLSGSSFPIKIPVGTRFLHLIFAELKAPLRKGYSGKYQGTTGVSLPKR